MAMIRFVVLATQRTGSTWLVEMLNSHPLATVYSELLLDSKQPRPRWGATDRLLFRAWRTQHPGLAAEAAVAAYLDELWTPRPAVGDHAVGFKLMYTQATAYPNLPQLLRERQARVVHLIRANPLRVLVSRETAVQRNLFHAAENAELHQPRLRLSTERLVERLGEIETEATLGRRLSSMIADRPLEIEYDELAADRGTFDRVLAYLGLPAAELHAGTRQLLHGSVTDVIDNYAEVSAALSRTRFARWLEVDRAGSRG